MQTTVRDLSFAIGLRLTRLTIRLAGFRRTVVLARRVPTSRRTAPPLDSATAWAEAIERVGGRPYGGTCLDRSVFLWWLMRVRGLDGFLRIGVLMGDDRIEAHAWVELDGVVVNDEPDIADRFEVFDDDPTGLVFS